MKRAYGVPKIHKKDNPLRIIISSVDTPLHNLAAFLHNILHKSLPPPPSHVYNSFHLSKILSDIQFDSEFELVSLDVVSLFTNVPWELALSGVEKRWHLIEENTNIPLNEFTIALKFIFHSTHFMFNHKFYTQIFGAPMGSPLSPVLTDIVLQDLETVALSRLNFTIPLYVRYVDDVVMMALFNQFQTVLDNFNSIHPRLQFTLEIGHNGRISFLDLTIIKLNNSLIYDWYHKPTFSGRYVNFFSNHPLNQKKCTVLCLVDKVFFLSHPQFHEKNFKLIFNILINNNYPIKFIFDLCKNRLKYNFIKNNDIRKFLTNRNDIKNYKWLTIPYIKNISEKIVACFPKNTDTKTAFTGLNKITKFIKVLKDPLPPMSKSNVIYKINCVNCDASYVGQTRRMVQTRICEHKNHINRNTTQNSVITEHRITMSHDFDWENVEILDMEPSFHRRLVSEMLHIKSQKNGLNLQSDTDLLDISYLPLIGNLHE